MKKFWISCVLALVLTALVGLGFVPTPVQPAAASEKAAKSEGGSKKSEKGEKGGEGSSEFTYIHMPPLVLPMIGENGADQLVTLMVDLQVKDVTVSDTVRAKMPRVQDTVIQDLYDGFADGTLRDGDRVAIAKVKAKIASALDKALGGHMVDDVLIQGVAQRML